MMELFDVTVSLEVVTCSVCGLVFALPSYYAEHLRENHVEFLCPHGCRLSFKQESRAEKAERELRDTTDQLLDCKAYIRRIESQAKRKKKAKTKK